jgi:TIR domain
MASAHTKIFLSYRRSDTRSDARLLRRELERTFASDEVFRDIEDAELGQGLSDLIRDQIGRSETVLVLIGPTWLRATASDGNRRIDNHDDYVRIEIRTALDMGKRVVPVYIEETPQLQSDDLPNDIRRLADLNSHRLRDGTYAADILQLISTLPRTELTLGQVLGSAALGGFANDVIGSVIRSGLMSGGSSSATPLLMLPLLEGVRYGVLAFFILSGLRRFLRLSYQRVAAVAGWIALSALVGQLLNDLVSRALFVAIGSTQNLPFILKLVGYLSNGPIEFVVIGIGGCWAIASAFGKSPRPLGSAVGRLAICGILGLIPGFLVFNFHYHNFVLPSAIAAGINRALNVVGLLWAAGGVRAWGRNVAGKIGVAVGLGQFVGSVLLACYYWLLYRGELIPDTFDPKSFFIYAAIGLAVFIQLGRISPIRDHMRAYRSLTPIGIALLCVCSVVAFFLTYPGRRSPQDSFRDEMSQRINAVIDKLQEKRVINEKEADELRTSF